MKNIPKTIKKLQKGLLEKEFSAAEITDYFLRRIEKENKQLNIYLTVTKEKAFEDASKVDEIIKTEGKKAFIDRPLLGVPVAHKDLFLTKGIRTTAGSLVLNTYIPSYSASVVTKLEEAGVILMGKVNCDAWAHGASGENSDYGPTKNPWNKAYVPGGSSSGSAASVASGMSMVATGTDTGGSIRQPANFCGVVGFKPTYGAVSRYGVIAMGSSLDAVGHITNSVEDAKMVFDVTRGEDKFDSTVKNFPSFSFKSQSRTKLKLGVPKEYFTKGLKKEVEEAVLASAKVFQKDGVELVDIALPHTKYAISVYYIIQPAEVSSNLGRYDGIRYGNDREAFGDEAKRRIMLGTYVLSSGYYDAYYIKAMKVRTKIREDFDLAFSKVDAIIAPVSPTPAFRLGEKSDNPLQMYLADIFTVAANVAGLPGIAIPNGKSQKGLPLGFQLIGSRFSENILFALGSRFQKLTGWKPQNTHE